MTEQEWLEFGYSKGIIELQDNLGYDFERAYKDWFLMKSRIIKPQSLDRIEVTWKKYFCESALSKRNIQIISERDIVEFVSEIIIEEGNITEKKLSRIWEITKGVLTYSRDCNVKSVPLYDWERIKRQLPHNKLVKTESKEEAISADHVRKLIDSVVKKNIYPFHRNCALLLCMNFYMGLRVGELAALTFSDFDFDKKVIKITKTESKFYKRDENGVKCGSMVYRITESTKTVYSVREIPMMPEVHYFYSLIKKQHEERHYESQYLAYDGMESVFVRSLDRTLRYLCNVNCIPYFSTHCIRKTVATTLHMGGVPSRVIADILGHSEIATTENCYIKSYSDNWNMVYNYMHYSLNY